jgi:hypothetical protein
MEPIHWGAVVEQILFSIIFQIHYRLGQIAVDLKTMQSNVFIPSIPLHTKTLTTQLKSSNGAYTAVVDISEADRAVSLHPFPFPI